MRTYNNARKTLKTHLLSLSLRAAIEVIAVIFWMFNITCARCDTSHRLGSDVAQRRSWRKARLWTMTRHSRCGNCAARWGGWRSSEVAELSAAAAAAVGAAACIDRLAVAYAPATSTWLVIRYHSNGGILVTWCNEWATVEPFAGCGACAVQIWSRQVTAQNIHKLVVTQTPDVSCDKFIDSVQSRAISEHLIRFLDCYLFTAT